jgi:pyruvate formate lyase activating enzyme
VSISGIIFDIRRFCLHDGPGIRTTVFFKGCPLDCRWCHNPEARKPYPEVLNLNSASETADSQKREVLVGYAADVESVMKELVRDTAFYDQSGGGVTFSGGEPTAQPEFLEAALRACKQNGLHTTVDTCGYAPFEVLERIRALTDLFLFDLKLMDSQAHREHTGMPNDLILINLNRLAGMGSNVWIRVPLVPEITDTEENLGAMADFLQPLTSIRRINLLPYNKLGEDKIARYRLPRKNIAQMTQTRAELVRKAERFAVLGFEVKIGG